MIHAWSIKRLETGERWSKNKIEAMRGVPGQPNPNKPGSTIPVKITMPETAALDIAREPEVQGRRVYLKEEDFEKYGYTEGCAGCRAIQAGHGCEGTLGTMQEKDREEIE